MVVKEPDYKSKNFIRFDKLAENRPYSSGGDVQVSSDGKTLFVLQGNRINAMEIPSFKFIRTFEADEHKITAFNAEGEYVITVSENQCVRVWNIHDKTVQFSLKSGHRQPVTSLCLIHPSKIVVTASSDYIRLYDIGKKVHIRNIKCSKVPISYVCYIRSKPNFIFAISDNLLRIWNIKSGTLVQELRDHTSPITTALFYGGYLYTLGRDKLINIYDDTSFKKISMLVLFEEVESMVIAPKIHGINSETDQMIYTVGSDSKLKIWSHNPTKCHREISIASLCRTEDKQSTRSLVQRMQYIPSCNGLLIATHHSDLLIFDINNQSFTKHIALNLSQVFCVAFANDLIVVASDSPIIRLFDSTCNECLQVLHGHDDTVICLDYRDKIMVSGGKDEKLIFWCLDDAALFSQKSVGVGHIGTVTTVSISETTSKRFVVSASDDNTLKRWNLEFNASKNLINVSLAWSSLAHKKISPKNKFIITASSDKTAKIWDQKGKCLSTLSGHSRPLMCADFSPVDKIVATGSADMTIRLWSLDDYTCKDPIPSFLQLRSYQTVTNFWLGTYPLLLRYSSGLIKVWSIPDNVTVLNLEGHNEKVWTLAINENSDLVTGDSEGCFILWKNTTNETRMELKQEMVEQIELEQNLSNLMKEGLDNEAIKIALELGHSKTLFELFNKNLNSSEGQEIIRNIVKSMSVVSIENLMNYLTQWNKNTKYYTVAQYILHYIVIYHGVDVISKFPKIVEHIETLTPYTKRHLDRIYTLEENAYFLEFMIKQMNKYV